MSGHIAPSLLQLSESSELEINVHLSLAKKSIRQEQKLKTLSKYVQKYPQGWKKRLELANLLFEMGNWQAAVTEYRQVIERQPYLLRVWLQLGKILHIMRREKEAVEVYEQALSCAKNKANQHHIQGLIAVCQNESEKAITAFNLAASLEPEKVVHWLALAQVHQQLENPLGVLSALEQVLSISPDDVVALIYSYDALLAVGNISAARACFQTSPPDSDPPQPPLRRGENSVKVPLKKGDLGGSLSLKTDLRGPLSKAIALAPNDFRVLQRQIEQRCQMRLVSGKEGKQTKSLITVFLRQIPHGVEAYHCLAYYHILRGDWAQGVEVFAKFTAEHPNYPYGWYYYGRCLFDTGNYQQAAQMMVKAYELYGDDGAIYQGLCEILFFDPPQPPLKRGENSIKVPQPSLNRGDSIKVPLFKGDLGGSLGDIVEEMLRRFPQRWSVWATAGRVLVEYFKEIERGCRVAEQSIKLQPQLADAWFRYGRVLALALKHQEAVEALKTGWELLPAGAYLLSVPAAVWLGESYGELGDSGASERWLRVACQGCQKLRGFNPAMADYWLGRALMGLGDKLGAIEAYEKALSQQLLYPARGEVEQSLRRLKGKGRKGSRG